MIIRLLADGELETFARTAGRIAHAAAVQDYLQQLLTKGNTYPAWCFLLEEAHQIIGTIAYWTLPSLSTPTVMILMELPWERDDFIPLGAQMIQHAVRHMQELGAREQIGHVIDLPPSAHSGNTFLSDGQHCSPTVALRCNARHCDGSATWMQRFR